MNGERIAILPGSYDPITKGHVALIARAAKLFDKVVVAVMQNSEKTYFFTEEERRLLAEASVSDIPNCEVISDGGLLIDLYRRLGATCVVKGVRNETDYRYESTQAEWNRAHLEGFETLYMPADGAYAEISSTAVRTLLSSGKGAEELLVPAAAALLREMRK